MTPAPGRRVAPAILVAVTAVWAAGFAVVQFVRVRSGEVGFLDLLVYRSGGHAMLTGHCLYCADFAAVNQSPKGLPFTYPPFAAVVFVPLALVPAPLAAAATVLVNIAAAAILFGVVVMAAGNDRNRQAPVSIRSGAVTFAAAAGFVLTVPVQANFAYGQVGLVLAAAVALDVLLPATPWPRGLLVGLAAAIKLTPAVFLGYFLLTRQWRALAVSLAAAASATTAGWLADPADTVRYLTSTVADPARIGDLTFAANQSLRGIIERIPALDGFRGVLWTAATVAVLAVGAVAIEAGRRHAEPVAAMLAAAFVGLLCSPVSWGHHWVWLSATVAYLVMRWSATGQARNLAGALLVAAVTLVPPWILLPAGDGRERLWNPLQHLLGATWAVAALLLLAVFAAATPPPPASAPGI